MLITFQQRSGDEQSVDAGAGESVMRAAVTNGVPGIEGECNGELNCGTCHVYVDDRWCDRLAPRSDDEDALIEVLDDPRPSSRLGCQISMTDKLDGLVVTVATE